jgi:hypothetical protein
MALGEVMTQMLSASGANGGQMVPVTEGAVAFQDVGLWMVTQLNAELAAASGGVDGGAEGEPVPAAAVATPSPKAAGVSPRSESPRTREEVEDRLEGGGYLGTPQLTSPEQLALSAAISVHAEEEVDEARQHAAYIAELERASGGSRGRSAVPRSPRQHQHSTPAASRTSDQTSQVSQGVTVRHLHPRCY